MSPRLAILSDTHDHIWQVDQALPHLRQAHAVLHAGDWVAPFTLKRLAEGLAGVPLHGVFGNNDGERRVLAEVARGYSHVTLHGEFASLEIAGLRVAVTHYPDIARAIAQGDAYQVVVYGHDHQARQEWIGDTLLLNPGELFGGLTGRSTFVWLDPASRGLEWVTLPLPRPEP